jgi:hypothetical protein
MESVPILLLAGFCLSATTALAADQDGDSVDEYLRRKGLAGAECLARSPHDLVGWITQREHLRGEPLTTGGEQDVIDHFYAHYRAALRPVNDKRYPKAARTLRGPLLDLHWYIYHFMIWNEGYRSYVTRRRVAAFTEHELAEIVRSKRTATDAFPEGSHPAREDVVEYARRTAKEMTEGQWPTPTPDQFAATVRTKLKAVEAAVPKRKVWEVRTRVMEFFDHHLEELNPNI